MAHITEPAAHTASVGGSVMPVVTAMMAMKVPVAAQRHGVSTTEVATHSRLPTRGSFVMVLLSCAG